MTKFILENWSITIQPNPYMAPEQCAKLMQGKVYGRSPEFEDGTFITTTRIITVFEDNGACVLTSSGSVYKLGSVDVEYEKAFPDALNRLITSYKTYKPSSTS